MIRANRLRFLNALATADGGLWMSRGMGGMRRWFARHGLVEIEPRTCLTRISAKGLEALRTGLAEYDAHGRLTDVFPVERGG